MDENNLEEKLFEALSRAARMKKARTMKRLAGKLAAKRKVAMKKRSTPEKIQQKARKAAIDVLKKKLSKGKNYNELPDNQKQQIDKKIEKKKGAVERIAKKMVKVIRAKEAERLSGGSNND